MDIKFWMSTLIGTALAIGTVQAFADSGWNYDEDSDTIIFSYNSNPATHSTSPSHNEDVKKNGAWYYEEGSDSIVFNSNGSRSNYARSNTPSEVFGHDVNLAFLDQ